MAAASCGFPDIFCWVQNLPPISKQNSMSLCMIIYSSGPSQPSLKLSITKNNQSPNLSLAIIADFNLPVSLWTSKPFKPSYNSNSRKLVDEETMFDLFVNFIEDVLRYGSNKNSFLLDFLKLDPVTNFDDMFNFTFLTLLFLVCIYEAPADLRSECLNALKNHLEDCRSRRATKSLMKLLGSNLEEKWMRSVNLAITSWITELQATHGRSLMKAPSPLFSYAISTLGLWKVHLYCPVKAMDIENSSNLCTADERLQFSLTFHQLEGVVQFNYKLVIQETWVEVMVNTDNIRCDVIKLVNETLMNERGVGAAEKHFPSRISLQLTPIRQNKILSLSVSKSTENPTIEFEYERSIEAGFEPQNTSLGLKVSAGETMTMSLKPWKFEQSVDGYSANLNWFLHDSTDGREVFSSKPSKLALLNPKAWFRERYSSAYRPFNRQGGVVFAGDVYGERVCWKVDKSALGRSMEWELRGRIWLTYWPNKYKTFYHETRRLEFTEILHLTIA